jgi:hypothetical protein
MLQNLSKFSYMLCHRDLRVANVVHGREKHLPETRKQQCSRTMACFGIAELGLDLVG